MRPPSSLFEPQANCIELAEGFFWLSAFVDTAPLLAQIDLIAAQAAFRHMQVSGGKHMSVAMTNCGPWGWTSSSSGYRYTHTDPLTDRPWPAMPDSFMALAQNAAATAGFENFEPDACLVNRYDSGAALGVHQDRDEQDLGQPIVSVSIGAAATFQVGGLKRSEPLRTLPLHDGDVLVWGGPSRLRFHGLKALKPMAGGLDTRHNLTFRKAK
ncbi:DNA oxidative demethylase AlkB [Aquabacterium sp.]|uniref:DNA oxidative demethylase AlkB n=1 Tax=Aquabacterium sp. TaxID=1872578 RepID=UPI00198F96D4|nr:DNA oxidative demethylase AlkB [Aquabacterium sp.]MBC7701688.1 DNA oxidative demethylase AlkB [Aquabacterium sp.]